jgi:hypothetical protein
MEFPEKVPSFEKDFIIYLSSKTIFNATTAGAVISMMI